MILDGLYNYWFYAGAFYLLWLTWQDMRNNRKVDDRKNWFMMGMTFSLLSHIKVNIIYLMVTVIVTGVLFAFMLKVNALGRADTNTIAWIFSGLAIIGIPKLIFYTAAFGIAALFVLFMKKVVFRYEPPVPFYPVFLITFILTMVFFKAY